MLPRRVLFVCGKARQRSPTAADLVAGWPGFETDYAGLSNDADERLGTEHIGWADTIVVMERRQKTRLTDRFGPALRGKRIVVLDVRDNYTYMQPELVAVLSAKLRVL